MIGLGLGLGPTVPRPALTTRNPFHFRITIGTTAVGTNRTMLLFSFFITFWHKALFISVLFVVLFIVLFVVLFIVLFVVLFIVLFVVPFVVLSVTVLLFISVLLFVSVYFLVGY
jgi:hypothetical protein